MINPRFILIGTILIFVALVLAGLIYAERQMKQEAKNGVDKPSELTSDVLEIFHPVTKKFSIGYLALSIIGPMPIFIMSLIKLGAVEKALLLYFIFSCFIYLLISIATKINNSTKNKIILHKNGLSTLHRIKNKRTAIRFEQIETAVYDEFFKEIQINGKETNAEVIIPMPIRNFVKFKNQISRFAGENNSLAKALINCNLTIK